MERQQNQNRTGKGTDLRHSQSRGLDTDDLLAEANGEGIRRVVLLSRRERFQCIGIFSFIIILSSGMSVGVIWFAWRALTHVTQ